MGSVARIDSEFSRYSSGRVDLRSLIGHGEGVPSDCPLEMVHKRFGEHRHEFMAVLNGEQLLGICSRHEIGMRLGARYGFALFSRKPVRLFLSPPPVVVRVDFPIEMVLETVFARGDESFYDDVVLVDGDGKFLGLIYVHTLVRIQTQFLRENITLLEQQKRVVHEKNAQMEEDLAMAREIQLAMLAQGDLTFPAHAAPEEGGIRFSRLYQPAQKVGGDFIHVLPLADERVGIFIADVMGHGVRSALVTAMLCALVEDAGAVSGDPGQLLTQVNRALAAILRQAGDLMFATAFYLVVDREAGTIQYGCAGHPCALHLRRGAGVIDLLPDKRALAGPGLCVFDNAVYQTVTATLEGDDLLLLFTDGLIEAMDAEGELYGMERLQQALRSHADLEVAAMIRALQEDAAQFCGGDFEDDVCVAGLSVVSAALGVAGNGERAPLPRG